MFRRDKLLKKIKEALENTVTLSERHRLERMLEAVLVDVSKPVVANTGSSWNGQVDRQAGSFSNDELIASQLNKW